MVNNYLTHFIPNAIKRGYELKDTDTPFIWTTGSWLINEALKTDSDGSVTKARLATKEIYKTKKEERKSNCKKSEN